MRLSLGPGAVGVVRRRHPEAARERNDGQQNDCDLEHVRQLQSQ